MLSDTEADIPRLEQERDAAYRKFMALDSQVRMLQNQRSQRMQAQIGKWADDAHRSELKPSGWSGT